MVRLGSMFSTLLGPEGTTGGCLFQSHVAGGSSSGARHGLVSHTVGGLPGWWETGGLWVGRLLRIAQWTRASLWSSCQGRTVDALAPGADEGRGRPR